MIPPEAVEGYRRLAAAVLNKAVKDYVIYHMEGAERVRAAYRALQRDPRRYASVELRKGGLAGFGESHARQILEIPRDPGDFLFNDSPFHAMLDIDPERFRSVDFHKAFREIRWSTTTMDV